MATLNIPKPHWDGFFLCFIVFLCENQTHCSEVENVIVLDELSGTYSPS